MAGQTGKGFLHGAALGSVAVLAVMLAVPTAQEPAPSVVPVEPAPAEAAAAPQATASAEPDTAPQPAPIAGPTPNFGTPDAAVADMPPVPEDSPFRRAEDAGVSVPQDLPAPSRVDTPAEQLAEDGQGVTVTVPISRPEPARPAAPPAVTAPSVPQVDATEPDVPAAATQVTRPATLTPPDTTEAPAMAVPSALEPLPQMDAIPVPPAAADPAPADVAVPPIAPATENGPDLSTPPDFAGTSGN